MNTVKCPCCGKSGLREERSWDVCDFCGWEDDPLQRDEPDFEGGANEKSLNQAKEAYRKSLPIN